MSERRRYANPPIEEALCEFRFPESGEWDPSLPERVQAELGGDYSGARQDQRAVSVALEAGQGDAKKVTLEEGLAKVQLRTGDGKRLVAVGRDVLSIHMLRPYQTPNAVGGTGWDEFQPRIQQALEAYWRVAAPAGVQRVGVRYINKIVIRSGRVYPEEYIRCAPREVEGLPKHLRSFFSRTEYEYDDGVRLVVTHANIRTPPGGQGLVVDIDLIKEFDEPIGPSLAIDLVQALRDRERQAFESLITNRARELFNAAD